MEFMGRLKSFLPTVFASETVTEVQKENGAQSMSEGEATEVKSGSNHTEPPKKKEVNLREKPEFYSDILSEGEPNYDYFPERKERYKPAVWKILSMMEGREESHRMRCENNIYNILKEGGWCVSYMLL